MRAEAWCSTCGDRALVLGPSLDPAHPLVSCQSTTALGDLRHPQARPGITDRAELARVMEHHRIERERATHRRHLTDRLVASCVYCQAALTRRAAV